MRYGKRLNHFPPPERDPSKVYMRKVGGGCYFFGPKIFLKVTFFAAQE